MLKLSDIPPLLQLHDIGLDEWFGLSYFNHSQHLWFIKTIKYDSAHALMDNAGMSVCREVLEIVNSGDYNLHKIYPEAKQHEKD